MMDLFRTRSLALTAFLALLVALFTASFPAPAQATAFADTAFSRVWAKTDQGVASGSLKASWIWGPEPRLNQVEGYQQAPGGQRLVQYFDKSRMEINNPNADRNSDWYVTNGLLCRELVSGKMQIGDAAYENRTPANVPVGGDLDSAIGPTYATFTGLASLNTDKRAEVKNGFVNDTINRAGQIGTAPAYSQRARYATYEETLGHNIPDIFMNWMNNLSSRGVNWQYVVGLPLTEPYWAKFKVAGIEHEVLLQLFERRALTFDPQNDAAWQVEMGNIGLHYSAWRYGTASLNPGNNNPATTVRPGTGIIPTEWLGRVNAYRAATGLAALSEDSQLSADAAKHVEYMLKNPDDFRHDEYSDRPGFSLEGQKAAKESNLFTGGGRYTDKDAVDAWMESVFHRFGILRPELTRTGYAMKCDASRCVAVLNVIAGMNGPSQPAGVIYPGGGQQTVKTGLISWQFGSFDPLAQVVSATLKDSQGNLMPLSTTSPDNYFNVLSVKPAKPLAAKTTYTVEIKATQNGQPINQTWSFTTA